MQYLPLHPLPALKKENNSVRIQEIKRDCFTDNPVDGGGGGGCNFAYIMVYRNVRKIWGGFFDSNYKYRFGILAKIINMGFKIGIFGVKI